MRIKQNGQWVQAFAVGKDGITPHIGENGNWWFGDTDSGVAAGYSGPVLPAGLDKWTKLDDEYYIEKNFIGVSADLSAIIVTEDFEVNHTECLDGKLRIFVSAPPSQDVPFTVAFMQAKDELQSVSISEDANGNITMTNDWKIFGKEVVTVKTDAEGDPSGIVYNGIEIPLTFTKEVVE